MLEAIRVRSSLDAADHRAAAPDGGRRRKAEARVSRVDTFPRKPGAAVADFDQGTAYAAAVTSPDKLDREEATSSTEARGDRGSRESHEPVHVAKVFDELHKNEVRTAILERGIRPDGRGTAEIRALSAEVGLLPRTHGSGLFTRGQTQVLSVATLGSVGEEQILDNIGIDVSKRYMHHYNFPPYSDWRGQGRSRGASRRDIGHGNLAERALDRRSFPRRASFPTRSVWCRRSSPPTARPPWRASAGAPSP